MITTTKNPLRNVYSASFFFATSIALAAYINSSFLGQIIGERRVGLIYTFGALLTFVGLTAIPRLVKKLGNTRALLSILIVNLLTLVVFASGIFGKLNIPFFLAYVVTNSLVIFCFDIFIEHFSNRNIEGRARGTYLSIINLAWVLMPALAGILVASAGYARAYLIAAVAVTLCGLVVITRLRGYSDVNYNRTSWRQAWNYVKEHHDILRVVVINFLLQFFYAWMVIYTPIYLHQHIGLSWPTIGIIFTVMLTPFVFLPYTLGKLSDKIGEKKFLIMGLICMAMATALLFFIKTPTILIWTAALFATRLGAAAVEVMADVYFFKHIRDSDPSVISFYRDMYPLAYFIAPLLASALLIFLPFKALFLILGLIVLSSLFFATRLKDMV
ncbi:hypothetical protein A3I25_02805 [Candidatus Nomurabacteria bacterium RIFCSPLOWO2_02_FULL_42_17]|uniref:Major facilitator superfamily (MFS) profile domain-containing protein n=2 Tax=Candidatus Nomuraibacteriota TaxID=1752729 RepID=A0A1F6WH18_9BACT|nr:MAG: Osmoprotectant transporter OusA [Parcubacteria group bacterium GW2011_GWA2_42_18]OGI81114.1 MAG: hypothetical protein A3B93_00565 [Candidatus Nomurabacteria bacterium RIFCSPHIGHO2_02_FULL_42_24]OGI97584.1 MAG: hypothetical protein A3I25_02805 [Candidatus Nomurabacteria bacterium RIFCSPLOWO2_02_FULL_42_17]